MMTVLPGRTSPSCRRATSSRARSASLISSKALSGTVLSPARNTFLESSLAPKPGWGSGSLLISNLSYQWDGTPTVELTPGNNTLQITTPGGNDVEGNGGTDTVIYNGIYAQFQIKSSGAETLVTENNNISTLDYLQGITYIQFANGTYDTLTSIFTPQARRSRPLPFPAPVSPAAMAI